MLQYDIKEKHRAIKKQKLAIKKLEDGLNGLEEGLAFFQDSVKNKMTILHIKKLKSCRNSLRLALNLEKQNLRRLESELKTLNFKRANEIEENR